MTDVLIIDHKPNIDEKTIENLNIFLKDNTEENQSVLNIERRYFIAHKSLNDVIVAYHSATNHLFGGYAIQRLSDINFFDSIRHEHTIITPEDYELSDKDIEELLYIDAQTFIPGKQFNLDLVDASESELINIEKHINLHQNYIFYQFSLDAKSSMAHRDFTAGLLYSVVALEGAHAVVLQLCLRKRFSEIFTDANQLDKYTDEKASKLLKDVGFFEMLEMTSLLFLDKEDKLSIEEIKSCQKGITIRNEIMHALSSKGGYCL